MTDKEDKINPENFTLKRRDPSQFSTSSKRALLNSNKNSSFINSALKIGEGLSSYISAFIDGFAEAYQASNSDFVKLNPAINIQNEWAKKNLHLYKLECNEHNKPNFYCRTLFPRQLIYEVNERLRVRSKAELIIARNLIKHGIEFIYEQPVVDKFSARRYKIPDFYFVSKNGEILIWEHLGMLDDSSYRLKWERKLIWYENNGFVVDKNLILTQGDFDGDNIEINRKMEFIRKFIG